MLVKRKWVIPLYVTKDGDVQGWSHAGSSPLRKVERLAIYLRHSQIRASNQEVYSYDIFHSWRQEEKEIAESVKHWLKIWKFDGSEKLFTKFIRDLEKMSSFLPKILKATVACYEGDCSMCAADFLVCYEEVVSQSVELQPHLDHLYNSVQAWNESIIMYHMHILTTIVRIYNSYQSLSQPTWQIRDVGQASASTCSSAGLSLVVLE